MEEKHVLEFDSSYLIYGGGISFVLNVLLFRVVSPKVASLATSKYGTLAMADQMEWSDRFISNVGACIGCSLSCYTLYTDEEMASNTVWKDNSLARLTCSIVIGYMIADMLCMLLWCKIPLGELMGYGFHHAATIYAYFFVSVYGILCYFSMIRLLAEMSNPFVNQRWFLEILGYPKSGKASILNGLLLLIVFFLCRILIMPVFWYQIWLVTGTPEVAVLGHIQLILYLPSMILDTLNIYWFYRIVKGSVKAALNLLNSPGDSNKDKSL